MEKNQYIEMRYMRKKQWYRLQLGFFQFVRIPILNIIWLALGAGIHLLNRGRKSVLCFFEEFVLLTKVINGCLAIIITIVSALAVIAVLRGIGELAARKDEADLVLAFETHDLRGGAPLLIHKKKISKKDVVIREFYSTIPLKRWNNRSDEIADEMHVRFVGNIEYGRKANRVVMKTIEGREVKDRGILYDEF